MLAGSFLILFILKGFSQENLFRNYSFEDTLQCPTTYGQINFSIKCSTPSNATPTYMNNCSVFPPISTPSNYGGFQIPKSFDAYVYLTLFDTIANYRDYLQIELDTLALSGKNYCISLYLSLTNKSKYAVTNIGFYLSNSSQYFPQTNQLPLSPHFETPNDIYYDDTLNWSKFEIIYTHNLDYKYIIIGNFRSDANTNKLTANPVAPQITASYYLDDVSIVALTPVQAGIDDTICPGDSLVLGGTPTFAAEYLWQPATGLDNSNSPNPKASPAQTTTYIVQQTQCSSITHDTVTVYVKNCPLPPDTTKPPEPFILPTLLLQDEYFSISGLPPGSRLWVYDIAGRLVYHSLHYRQTLHNSELATGIYLVRLQNPDGTLYRSKLMIVK